MYTGVNVHYGPCTLRSMYTRVMYTRVYVHGLRTLGSISTRCYVHYGLCILGSVYTRVMYIRVFVHYGLCTLGSMSTRCYVLYGLCTLGSRRFAQLQYQSPRTEPNTTSPAVPNRPPATPPSVYCQTTEHKRRVGCNAVSHRCGMC